ncbi:peptidase inhibitor family I36 protein [Actinomadura terrae]|uniref:peptidase inhibitor family I36 protein n=1 Tax=Actinomadura terrae TaxID=604353 RepID=UPI001FA7F53A|nr:peptidase inhibitor family I36 protein [Actinomadura terrae]
MIKRNLGIVLGVAIAGNIMGVVLAPMSLAATSGPPTEAQLLKRAADQCEAGVICFWANRDFSGNHWSWSPRNGYRDMPPYLHDNVASFYANAAGCFIDWEPRLYVRVAVGDYSKSYKAGGKFGSRIDAVTKLGDCHA